MQEARDECAQIQAKNTELSEQIDQIKADFHTYKKENTHTMQQVRDLTKEWRQVSLDLDKTNAKLQKTELEVTNLEERNRSLKAKFVDSTFTTTSA